jgi:hypothetical protein
MNPSRAFPLLMKSEAGLCDFDLTRFLHTNRYQLRPRTLWSRKIFTHRRLPSSATAASVSRVTAPPPMFLQG